MIFLFAFLSLTLGCAVRDLATKNALKWVDADVMAGCVGLWISVLLFPYVVWKGIPSLDPITFWAIALNSLLYFSGKYFNFVALKMGDLSYITPLKWIVTISIILTELIVFWVLPGVFWILWVFLVFAGVYVLNIKEKKNGVFGPVLHLFTDRASQLYLITVVCYSFTSVLDKVIVLDSYPVFWIFLSNLLLFGLSLKKILSVKTEALAQIIDKRVPFFASMFLNGFTQVSQMYVVSQIFVSYTSAFKAASSLLAVFLWGYFLQEKNISIKLVWAIIIFLGIILITFFGS